MHQQDDYYPFGFEINRKVNSPKNLYLYNKKELQPEFTAYDYGARFYDPVIGRWNGIDILADYNSDSSPYSYAANNPVNFADEMGLDTITAAQAQQRAQNGNLYESKTPLMINLAEVTISASNDDDDDDGTGSTTPSGSTTPPTVPPPAPPATTPTPDPGTGKTENNYLEKIIKNLVAIPEQPYDLGGNGLGTTNSQTNRPSTGMDCTSYISHGFGDGSARTWATHDEQTGEAIPPPKRWGLHQVNLGSTKAEISKHLRNGDLLVWYKKGGTTHHAGLYLNGGLMNSGSSTGPTKKPNMKSLKYYYFDDIDHPEIPIPTVYRHQ